VVESYEVTLMPGGTSIVVPASSTSATIPGLQPGTDYQINVVARNAAGASPSATTSGTPAETAGTGEQPPPPPAEPETLEEYCNRLYGPPPGPGEVNMMWTLCMHDPTQDEPPDPSQLPQPVPPPEEA
jgi:hypothetical protein